MKKDIEEKINSLSMLEQNASQLGAQRQSLQGQLLEIDSALEELDSTQESYRIIGNIMVKVDRNTLKDDLEQKKKMVTLKLASIEKQEASIHDRAKKLQQDIMAEIDVDKKEK
jgi:prefoldin beta subunit